MNWLTSNLRRLPRIDHHVLRHNRYVTGSTFESLPEYGCKTAKTQKDDSSTQNRNRVFFTRGQMCPGVTVVSMPLKACADIRSMCSPLHHAAKVFSLFLSFAWADLSDCKYMNPNTGLYCAFQHGAAKFEPLEYHQTSS
jgi:hypothetical protein